MQRGTSAASGDEQVRSAVERRDRIRETWKARGVSARAATILYNAGCETHDDLKRVGYEGIAKLQGVGANLLKEIGGIIEADWPPADPETSWWREKAAQLAWIDRGVGMRTVTILLKCGCKTVDDVRRTDYRAFLKTDGAGEVTMREIGKLIGEEWPLRWWTDGRRNYRDADADDLRAELELRGYTVIPPLPDDTRAGEPP